MGRHLQSSLHGIFLYEQNWQGCKYMRRMEDITDSIVTGAKVGVYLRNKIIQKISCECPFVLILWRLHASVQLLCRTTTRGIDGSMIDCFSRCVGYPSVPVPAILINVSSESDIL